MDKSKSSLRKSLLPLIPYHYETRYSSTRVRKLVGGCAPLRVERASIYIGLQTFQTRNLKLGITFITS